MALLRTVDAAEADSLGVGVVEHLKGVAIEDGDHGAGETSYGSGGAEQEQERAENKDPYDSMRYQWRREKKTSIR